MSEYYFAYGSNMNAARMTARGLQFKRALAGSIGGLRLAFNKRSASRPDRTCANVMHCPDSVVEGVLYQLSSVDEIFKMDPFEDAPLYYSREIYLVESDQGQIPAWVYVGNRAVLVDGLLPEHEYVAHLLEGRGYLSEAYFQQLLQIERHPPAKAEGSD